MQDVDVFAPATIDVSIGSGDKPSCPMCLFAITEAKEVIKNEKTKEKIKHTLNSLCNHLPVKLQLECRDFVETYTAELVEMLMNDFTPQEICVYLKSCTDQKPDMSLINLKLSVEKSDDVWVPVRPLSNGDIGECGCDW
jgi:saposin